MNQDGTQVREPGNVLYPGFGASVNHRDGNCRTGNYPEPAFIPLDLIAGRDVAVESGRDAGGHAAEAAPHEEGHVPRDGRARSEQVEGRDFESRVLARP